MKKIFSMFMSFLIIASTVLLPSCVKDRSNEGEQQSGSLSSEKFDTSSCYKTAHAVSENETDYVQLTVENDAYIVIELYPDTAPITVENFKKLVRSDFYDGIIFHRIISGFMIQGGDPLGTGHGGSGESIKGEFSANGVENDISHERGVISMARLENDCDSASSQFFIVQKDAKHLNGQYAAFGKVVAGMETVDAIAAAKTDANDKPLIPIHITSAEFVDFKPESK